MPVTEALSLDTPFISSNLVALCDAGGAVTDYLDPLDGVAWSCAISAYSDPASPRAYPIVRGAQAKRR